MRFRRHVEPIDRVGRKRSRAIEPRNSSSCRRYRCQSFSNAHRWQAAFAEFVGDGQRAIAANREERIGFM
jgi:hypothetical protein